MTDKLQALRGLMKKRHLEAYFIPGSDPHQSECVPEFWRRLAFVSGFTGSAGDVVVTMKSGGLWTDSRYYLQAEQELRGSGLTLFRAGMPGVPPWPEWIIRSLSPGDALGFDPQLISHRDYVRLKKAVKAKDIRLRPLEKNLVDAIWRERPAPPAGPVLLLPEKYAGESTLSKLARLRQKMSLEGADAHVITQLDAVAWLYNIRGSDVPYNPVVIAYAIVTQKKAVLYVAREKINPKARLPKELTLRDYAEFPAGLHDLAAARQTVWLDDAAVSQWVVNKLARAKLLFKPSPVALAKAIKNKTEIEGARRAHLRDGAAMVEFLSWLEKSVPKGGITELVAARKLEEIRRQKPLFRGLSFQTISSYRSHGAIVHYRVGPETDFPLKPKGLYLIDSGSHYLDATTDITRTVSLGKPTAEQKDRFTRVLKGAIGLSRTSFPQGTSGTQLDALARLPLWEVGQNYGHGTGHGIGAFLNVHEGPQGIAPGRGFGIGLEPGMILSIEPGFYKQDEYGLRVENLVLVVTSPPKSSPGESFCRFETLTLCPIDLRLVEEELLTENEVHWLNAYHQKVREQLTPLLGKVESEWLKKVTRPLSTRRSKRRRTKISRAPD